MAVKNQVVSERYAIYNGDSAEMMQSIPDESIHLSIYSPPFGMEKGGALYTYSSSERDLSNARTYEEFWDHYRFIIEQITRVTLPGRITAVHCTDIPINGGCALGGYADFPGDIIRAHRDMGWQMLPRYTIYNEPLSVRLRTMSKALSHRQVCEDSTLSNPASSDYLICFRKKGNNPVPVTHEHGFMDYAGATPIPAELMQFKGFQGKQTQNKYSHWIWRNYAQAVWTDIRWGRVLEYKQARDHEDEKHVHPLQLDVIERCCALYSNPNETVFTPFMGVGSEVYGAVINGRRGMGCELKESYFRQAVRNLESIGHGEIKQDTLFFDPIEGMADTDTGEEE